MRVLAGLALAVLASSAALAVDNPIPGRVTVVTQTQLAKFVSKSTLDSATFPIPAPGGASDPTINGAQLRFFDTVSSGGAGDVTFDLDASGWSGLGNPPGQKGYTYRGSDAVPPDPTCKIVRIEDTTIKATCRGAGVPLDPMFLGAEGIILGIPSATAAAALRYCAEFGGTAQKNDDTTMKRKDAPVPGACSDALPTPAVPFTTAGIVKVAEATQGGYRAEFYENRAYTCGVSGYHTFVLAWPDGVALTEPRPLWVRLHGGGAGAFNESGSYVPSFWHPGSLDQETFAELSAFGFESGLMARVRAHPAGFRAVIPSLCDHDLYAGIGLADPNNPNSPDENGNTRATDGLLAAEAAVEFARTRVASTATFVHGTSAGSAGAFHVAYGLEEHGMPVTGIVMDSGVNDHTAFAAFEAYLDANPGACPSAGFAHYDWDAMGARFAHILLDIWEPAYAVEHDLFSTPVFHLWDRRDATFCADTPIPYTDDDGTQKVMGANDLANEDLAAAIAANPPGGAGASVNLRVCSVTGPSTCGVHSPTISTGSIDADTGLDINQAVVDWVDDLLATLGP